MPPRFKYRKSRGQRLGVITSSAWAQVGLALGVIGCCLATVSLLSAHHAQSEALAGQRRQLARNRNLRAGLGDTAGLFQDSSAAGQSPSPQQSPKAVAHAYPASPVFTVGGADTSAQKGANPPQHQQQQQQQQQPLKGTGAGDAGQDERVQAVKAAMRHAWGGYEQYAFGQDELLPLSKSGKASYGGVATTIMDSLSTLWMMGMKEEYNKAKEWLVKNINFNIDTDISFFEITIRVLGGLLSANQLSGDPFYLEKAVDLGDRLLPAFSTSPTGIPDSAARLPVANTGSPSGVTCLVELGSDTLEFGTLSALTVDRKYIDGAEKGIRLIHSKHPTKGLLSHDIERSSGEEVGQHLSIGPRGDSYYEYLIKWWVLGGKRDEHWRARWELATDDVLRTLLVHSANGERSFVGENHGGGTEFLLPHLACYYPGSLALGVMSGAVSGAKAETYRALAINMTAACREMYAFSPTGLAPDTVNVDPQTGALSPHFSTYWQRPETLESIFYLHRLTRDPVYREWGWEIFTAIEKNSRQEVGYAMLSDAMQVPPQPEDMQNSWFLAETLKYLYLLFMPDSALDLTQWVLNTEAHPLKVVAPPPGAAAS